jgi:hypothetical protein
VIPHSTATWLSRAADVCAGLAALFGLMALMTVVSLTFRPEDLADVNAVRDLGQACAIVAGTNAAAWLFVRKVLPEARREPR